jgi:hypothetical protein
MISRMTITSVLHAHNDRAILEYGEMNSIAGLEVRSGPHLFTTQTIY